MIVRDGPDGEVFLPVLYAGAAGETDERSASGARPTGGAAAPRPSAGSASASSWWARTSAADPGARDHQLRRARLSSDEVVESGSGRRECTCRPAGPLEDQLRCLRLNPINRSFPRCWTGSSTTSRSPPRGTPQPPSGAAGAEAVGAPRPGEPAEHPRPVLALAARADRAQAVAGQLRHPGLHRRVARRPQGARGALAGPSRRSSGRYEPPAQEGSSRAARQSTQTRSIGTIRFRIDAMLQAEPAPEPIDVRLDPAA